MKFQIQRAVNFLNDISNTQVTVNMWDTEHDTIFETPNYKPQG